MKVMIVEDEMLLAMELESEVEAAGHTVVGMAASSSQVPAIMKAAAPEFAFVDIHLQDGATGINVGRMLFEKRIPYIFVSGNIKKLPNGFAGALGAIEKPYTMNGMANALAYIDAVVRGEEGRLPPASLVLAEDVA
ncbi:response regulator [Neorhizobium sp. NPDC001467]|uniref:response regulator n=1 Tax=Neorhizobium sp. NPDC001467 TaxID=3390595 RepID=UPI003D015106